MASGRIWPIYAVLVGIGLGRAFSGPAASAMLPSLVPKEHFVNAVTWGATVFQIANMSGPAVGGFCLRCRWRASLAAVERRADRVCVHAGDAAGVHRAGGHDSARRWCTTEKKAFSMKTVLAGLEYVWRAKLLLGSISLDLFAVMLGGAVALLPIFATDILHAGPRGLGLLRAMPSVGALVVWLTMLVKPIKRQAGVTMLVCVGIFGAATVVFGLSKSIWLSAAALVIVGASDMVSVVVRSSLLQLATPPEMRGRVSAVNWLFIGASNEFGEFESGCDGAVVGRGAGGGDRRGGVDGGDGFGCGTFSAAAQGGRFDGGVVDGSGAGVECGGAGGLDWQSPKIRDRRNSRRGAKGLAIGREMWVKGWQ